MVRMMLVLVCVAMFAGSCAAAEEPRSHLTRRRLATAVETGAEFTLLHTGLAKIQNDIALVKSLPANYLKVATSLRHSKQCLIDVKLVIKAAQLAAQAIGFIPSPSVKAFSFAAKQVLKLANDAVEIQNKMLAEPANARPSGLKYASTTTAGIIYVYEGGKGAKVKAACASVKTKLALLETAMKVPSTAAKATGLAFKAIADVAANAGKDATSALKHVDNTATSMYALADKMEKIVSNANAAYTKEFAKMAPFIKGVADAAAVVTTYEQAACSMQKATNVIKALMDPIVTAMNTKISLPCVCTPAVARKCVVVAFGNEVCTPAVASKCVLGQPAHCIKLGDTLVEASVQDVLNSVNALLKPLMDKATALIKPFIDAVANVLPKLPLPPIPKLPTIDTSGLTAFADSALVDISAIKDWAAMANAPVSSEAAIVTALKGCSIPFLIRPSWDPTTTEDGKTLKCENGGVPSKNGGGLASPEEFTQLQGTVAALGLKADKEVATSAAAVATADKEAKGAANKAAADAPDALTPARRPDENAASGFTVAAAAVSAVAAVVGLLM